MRYTVNKIKKIVAALAAQYGADCIYPFGSYARGDADKNSDIDLRIDKRGIRNPAVFSSEALTHGFAR